MRLALAIVVAGLLALPSSVRAQEGEEGGEREPSHELAADEQASDNGTLSPRMRKRTTQQWDPDTYELRLDSSGLSLSPPSAPPRKTDAQVRQYRKGVIVSSLVMGIGGTLIGAGVVTLRQWQQEQSQDSSLDFDLFPPASIWILFSLGSVAALGGLVGAAVSGGRLSARKQELRERQAAHGGNPSRVQWDLARSRLVF